MVISKGTFSSNKIYIINSEIFKRRISKKKWQKL